MRRLQVTNRYQPAETADWQSLRYDKTMLLTLNSYVLATIAAIAATAGFRRQVVILSFSFLWMTPLCA